MPPLHSLNTPAQHPTITLVDSNGNIFFPASSPISGTTTTAEPLDADRLTVGEATLKRLFMSSAGAPMTTSGRLMLGYFTARKSETTTQVRVLCGNAAAGATPTLCRVGLYTVAENGDIALVASTANDTALFATTFTAYTRSWSASYAKVANQRYALGVLVVSAAAMPTLYGNTAMFSPEAAIAPRLAGMVAGQTDLPSSVLAASIAATSSSAIPYAAILP